MFDLRKTLRRVIVPINKEGYSIIALSFGVTFLLTLLSNILGLIFFVVSLFIVYFFRNPNRFAPDNLKTILAPADGVVDAIAEVAPPEELNVDRNLKWTRVSIFLSVFNVHSQRIPVNGKVTQMYYKEGKFFNISDDKYSKDNEHQACVITTSDGLDIPVIQIAGLIARRIVCNLSINQEVQRGDVYGIIKFGSRVDIYLPNGIKPIVKVGQTMVGGETVIANL